MSDAQVTQHETGGKLASCFVWLVLFSLLGILATFLVNALYMQWIQRNEPELSRALLTEQIEQLQRGEISCLVQPDPRFLDDLLSDSGCAARICELYLGGDVSDERLGRLRELPNLKSIILLFAQNPVIFLERLQGMPSLEVLTLERTLLSRRGLDLLKRFPKLKSLCLSAGRGAISDMDGVKNHPSIENLVLTRFECDERLLPVLQSLPRLRSVTMADATGDAEVFEQSLRTSLPNCRCSVKSDPR